MYSKYLKENICQARMMGQSWGTISVNFNVPKSSCCKIVKNIGAQWPFSKKPNLKVTGNVKKRLILAIQNMKETNARITASRKFVKNSWLLVSKKIVFTDETRYNIDGPDNDMSWQQTTCRRKAARRRCNHQMGYVTSIR